MHRPGGPDWRPPNPETRIGGRHGSVGRGLLRRELRAQREQRGQRRVCGRPEVVCCRAARLRVCGLEGHQEAERKFDIVGGVFVRGVKVRGRVIGPTSVGVSLDRQVGETAPG